MGVMYVKSKGCYSMALWYEYIVDWALGIVHSIGYTLDIESQHYKLSTFVQWNQILNKF